MELSKKVTAADDLGAVERRLREPGEEFQFHGAYSRATLGDYWQWSSSSVLDNTERGILAEFLVGHALGLTNMPRVEWASYDLERDGTKIEVKSSAYLQSWDQKEESKIRFRIAPRKKSWDPITGKSCTHRPKRIASIYVFCLLKHKDKSTVDPLDAAQWEFYVVLTSRLNKNSEYISLLQLRNLTAPVSYGGLAEAINETA